MVSYMKLWHVLLESGMRKKDLAESAGISDFTIRKLSHDENVTIAVLERICLALNCTLDEICEIIPQTQQQEEKDEI